MKIIRLIAENVKRLQVVDITPAENMVVIGGRNAQGKSSVLDSIEFALGGNPDAPMPIHSGKDKARIVLDLGDLRVVRKFSNSGSVLVVENPDGSKKPSPQSLLDSLCGRIAFDPLAFARQKPEQQSVTLMKLVGLDFSEHDRQRESVFSSRTQVNRDIKSLQARLEALPSHPNAPKEESSASLIIKQQQQAAAVNQRNAKSRATLKEIEKQKADAEKQRIDWLSEIAALNDKIANIDSEILEISNREDAARIDTMLSEDVDLSQFATALEAIEQTNRKVRENKTKDSVRRELDEKTKLADSLTADINHRDESKKQKIASAKYPIDGLSFSTDGRILLNNIPFEQSSSAEQLKVSIAIGLALNSKLKVLLIRDGSLLDDDSLSVVAEMAAAADAQVWIERVGTDAHTSVVIEDGTLKENA